MKQVSHRPTLMALAAMASLLGYTGITFALPVVDAASSASTQTVTAVPVDGTSPGYANSQSNATDTTGQGSGYAFASGNGAYAVSSRADGMADGTAYASFLTTIVNDTGVAQSYSLSFHIYGGYIEAMLNSGATLVDPESLLASYGASVKVNGNSVFESSATIARDTGGIVLTKSGADLNPGDDGSDGSYSWGGAYYTIDLGVVAAGDSIAVLAEVDDTAFADVGSYDFGGGSGYGGCGYGSAEATAIGTFAATTGDCFKGYASAFYGDPSELTGQPFPGFNITGTPRGIPEPATLALAALALGAAGAAGRRRQSRL